MTALRAGQADVEGICARLGLQPTPQQTDSLWRYLQMLQRWNGTYNLTAVRDPAAMLVQHLADCLAVVEPMSRHAASHHGGRRLLDVGSGGGLPAALIAILMPDWSVTSVDAVGKKMAFVRQVAGELALTNLHAQHVRIEQLQTQTFDVITARAFATLADLVGLTAQHLARAGVWMAMKGRVPEAEIAALPGSVEVFHVEQLVVPGLDAARCLVWMRQTTV